ncbi:MAG: hypothetical protein L0H02_05795 [Yaniella sp.]|nr:hypothetical protein [Yaniella sp.]
MSTPAHQPRTYGLFRRPISAGILGLGTAGTVGLFAGLLLMIIGFMAGNLIFGIVTFLVTGIGVIAVTRRDRHNRNVLDRISTRGGYMRGKLTGRLHYRSGPTGRIASRKFQLPGLSAQSRLSNHRDGLGRDFAVIEHPKAQTYTVVIETEPDGAALVDVEQVDQWVAQWGLWLSNLGDEPGLCAASVTVETSPDPGHRLRMEVEANLDSSAPELAQDLLRDAVREFPAGSASIRAYIALTYLAKPRERSRRRDRESFAQEIATRLPGLTQRLVDTGAGGGARPLDQQGLCEVIRTAYDPAAAPLFAEARANGEVVDLEWEDVGPTAHEVSWTEYAHESATSVSYVMSAPPRGAVQSRVLDALIAPSAKLNRKRVTLLYHPIDPGVAAAKVEADLRNADFAVNSSKRPSQQALTAQRAARAIAQEEASGAGLVNFGMIITGTILGDEDLHEANVTLENLSAGARLLVRVAHGTQDTTFAAGLPLGIDLSRHIGGAKALMAKL